jgi:hypothetical protein
MAHRWNKTKKKSVLRIRLGRYQGRSRCLTAHSNRWKTGSDFAIRLISSPRWEQDTERKRRPSNDRVAGNKTEKKTVLSTPRGTRLRSAALQTIESAAESGFSRTFDEIRSSAMRNLRKLPGKTDRPRRARRWITKSAEELESEIGPSTASSSGWITPGMKIRFQNIRKTKRLYETFHPSSSRTLCGLSF